MSLKSGLSGLKTKARLKGSGGGGAHAVYKVFIKTNECFQVQCLRRKCLKHSYIFYRNAQKSLDTVIISEND